MTSRRRLPSLAAAFIGAALTVGAAPAAAAPSPAALGMSLTATVGGTCLQGTSSGGNGAITVTQRRGGSTIAQRKDTTGASWSVCLKPLKAGDSLRFTKGTKSLTVSVPDLRLTLDRGAGTAKGRVPVSNLDADVTIVDTIGEFGYTDQTPSMGIAANGTFSVAAAGLLASDTADLRWFSPIGHEWHRQAAIPGVLAEVGNAKVIVIGSIGSTRTVTLKASGGATRATASMTLTKGKATVTLKQNGHPVTVAATDTVSINGIPTSLTVIADDLDVGTEGGGSFWAHCQPFTRWVANLFSGGQNVYIWSGIASADGEIGTVGAWPGPGPIPDDLKVVLDCEDAAGLAQRMIATLP